MGRTYQHPPIIEVVCEFQFSADSPWDATVPGVLYERIKGTFPTKSQETFVAVEIPLRGPVPASRLPQLQGGELLRFARQDDRAFVQLQRNILAINHLQPYPAWERYLPMIQQAFASYQDVATPSGIHRIGLRYINRISIATEQIQPGDYFTLYPHISTDLPAYGGFSTQVLFPYEQGRDLLKVELASAADETGENVVAFLDLDYFLVQPTTVAPHEALDWVVQAHHRIEAAFEACITDQLRLQFDQGA